MPGPRVSPLVAVILGAGCNLGLEWPLETGERTDTVDTATTVPRDPDTADTASCMALSWFEDLDGDGWGAAELGVQCGPPPPGASWFGGDCDDTSAAIHPAAEEVCNHIDDDCDGVVDYDAPSPPTWWGDDDGDGYGGQMFGATVCTPPIGFVDNRDDCDDTDPDVHPGAAEVCDGIDQDCDGQADEDLTCP